MDAELLDLISRTRPVLFEILGMRGYDTSTVKDPAPEELLRWAATQPNLLEFKVAKKSEAAEGTEATEATEAFCHVLYWVEGATRLKIEGLLGKLWDDENPAAFTPERDEVVVVLAEPYHEVFDLQAIKLWSRMKGRISFFNIKNLVSNPAKHQMVPPHRKLTPAEVDELVQSRYLKSKSELPRIIYHVDMQARVLGLVPGDIVEIRRPSPTSGEYILYRVCTLS